MSWYRNYVAITHLPTGIKVISNCELSQVKNKISCINVLKSKLYALEHCTDEIIPTDAQKDIADYILKKNKDII